MIELKISKRKLNIAQCITSVASHEAGGIDVFVGTVRNKTNEKKVKFLFYETYEKMALKEMEMIAKYAIKKWGLKKVAIHHRIGKLKIGETAVVIAVSAEHRKETFDACYYIINKLKKTVPIWKKEVYFDGEEWVSPTP